MNTITTNQLIFVGDTHGEWGKFLTNLQKYNLKDCVVIHVGDVGIGYHDKDYDCDTLARINKFLGELNITMLAIRGNHDDPSYFNGDYQMSHLRLLPDYSKHNINGEDFLFVGGATSIDRSMNYPHPLYIESMIARGVQISPHATANWWSDEVFHFEPSKVTKCDVLVTHTAPIWIGPTSRSPIEWCLQQDPTLWDELQQERFAMNKLIKIAQPKKHFCGHFHAHAKASHDGCESRILNIHELYEYRK